MNRGSWWIWALAVLLVAGLGTLNLTWSWCAPVVSLMPNWPQPTQAPVRSSPALADIDGDGDLEIIVGSDSWYVYAWNYDGTAVPNWPQLSADYVMSSPVVGDINGDGDPEIVCGCGGYFGEQGVWAWHADGTVVAGWPATKTGYIESSPALGDIDGDGALEVVVGSRGGIVWAWYGDGTTVPGWPQMVGDTFGTPALGDIDGDGAVEIVVGDLSGSVRAWNGDGSPVAGQWPVAATGAVWSSPALGDIDGDDQLEVVVGSDDGYVYAWKGDGTLLAGWPQLTANMVRSSPALGDLDGDGDLEVVVGCWDHKVYAWHGNGTPVAGWPTTSPTDVIESSPALGDIDGDGGLEVVVGSYDDKVHAWHGNGTIAAGWSQYAGGDVFSSPALGDLNHDGHMEVVVGSNDGNVYVWTYLSLTTTDPAPWPTFHQGLARKGAYLGNLPGKLTGEVVISGTTTPIEGVTVDAYLDKSLVASGTTAADGTYTIPDLEVGEYIVIAHKATYVSGYNSPVYVEHGEVTHCNFALVVSGRLTGQVRERATGANISGASVEAYLGGELKATAITNSIGVYVIDSDLPPGIYSVAASKLGFATQTKAPIAVSAGATSYANFFLDRMPSLKGQVKERVGGAAIVGATVEVYNGSTLVASTTSQAPYGIYQFGPEVPAGTYMVAASKATYVRQAKYGITVTEGATTYVNFALDVSGILKGQVKDAVTIAPLTGATVNVYNKYGTILLTSGVCQSPYGVYEIKSDVPAGECVMRASKQGYVRQDKWGITVTSGVTTFVNFNLQVSGKLKGQVTDKVSGAPIIGALVQARMGGIVRATATSTAPYGVYEMDSDLAPGTYTMYTSKSGYIGFGRTGIVVSSGATTFVNFPLQPQ